jgi:putative membrane protein
MKRLILAALALTSALAVNAKDSSLSAADKAFMRDCAQAGMSEVKLGNIALKNANADAVKDFARQMIDEHTKANEALKLVAEKKNVQLPESLDAEKAVAVAKLESLKGKAFDKAYSTQMVVDHKKVSKKLSTHVSKGDEDLKAWTKDTLPKVQHHLDMALSMDKKIQSQ